MSIVKSHGHVFSSVLMDGCLYCAMGAFDDRRKKNPKIKCRGVSKEAAGANLANLERRRFDYLLHYKAAMKIYDE